MATHDIITVGASAGGVEALINLVQALPADLPAAVCVVLHMPSYHHSFLPQILARHGALAVELARDGARIEPGKIYVAPPDRHLLVRPGHVELWRGPHENRVRPAVDPLFRSAAHAYGPRVIGIVLSGTLYDGALGLHMIAARGGLAIVQDPAEAPFQGMPIAALEAVPGALCLPINQIAMHITRLIHAPASRKGLQKMAEIEDVESKAETLVTRDIDAQEREGRSDQTTIYTCPECGGTLWQIDQGGLTQFRCHVGHAYGAEALLGSMSEELEAVLWRCVRLLVEKATLTRQFATRMQGAGQDHQAKRMEERAAEDDRQGQLLRDLLTGVSAPTPQLVSLTQTMGDPVHNDGV